MYWIALTLTLLVALLHVYFLVLEMFLWARPLGLKTFRNTPEKAETTRVLAANQGLYNGFLAAGIVVGLVIGQPVLVTFSLACVVVAGCYGTYSVAYFHDPGGAGDPGAGVSRGGVVPSQRRSPSWVGRGMRVVDLAGRMGWAGDAVNPSLGAWPRHPCRGHPCPAHPPDPGQVPCAASPRRRKRRSRATAGRCARGFCAHEKSGQWAAFAFVLIFFLRGWTPQKSVRGWGR